MVDDDLRNIQRQIARLSVDLDKIAGVRAVPTFIEFAESYLTAKLARPTLRASTKKSFEHQVRKHLMIGFGMNRLDSITNAVWLEWVNATRARGSVTRFFNARKDLIEVLTAAKEVGHIEKVPKLDNPDEARSVGRVLTDKEVLAIIWHARRPFRLIFYAFWKMGCRPREILQWEWAMITWSEPGKTWIKIPARISKTDRTREIPLNPELSAILYKKYFGSSWGSPFADSPNRSTPFVYPSRFDKFKPQMTYHSAWSRACALANVKATAYDLRRTFITRCAAEGKPLVFIAKALDTSVQMIEKVYAKAQKDVMEGIIR